MLQLENLNVSYGEAQVLWGVSLSAPDGSLVSIVGPNGAGKTTALKSIAGLVAVSSGKVVLHGTDITNEAPHLIVEKGMSLVPEGRRLFPNLTVEENLRMGAYTKSARAEWKETVKRVYELFPVLRERERQVARTLSGGEAQMLAIGRAMMMKPMMLMLDEPSLGLAPKLVDNVYEAIGKLKKEGVTILLVEQMVTHALQLSDYAYLLENGRVVLEGTSDKIRNDDRTRKHYLGLI